MTALAEPSTEPLWNRARAMYARAVAAIGAAAVVAAIGLRSKSLRRAIIAWLCPLEHVVRKLLIAEAADLHRAEAARAKRRVKIELIPLRGMAHSWTAGLQTRAGASGKDKSASDARSKIDRTRPETWRAPFSFAIPHARRLPNARIPRVRALWGPTPPPPPAPAPRIVRGQDAPLRLARRFEALRRVLENPHPHAERLVRLLAREIPCSNQLVLRYVYAPCRSNDYDRADPRLGMEAMGAAFDHTKAAYADSS